MAHFKIDAGATVYQLVVDGVEGELVEYGTPSLCEVAGTTYVALVPDTDDDGNPTEVQIFKATRDTLAQPEVELVDFGDQEVYDDEDQDDEDQEEDPEDDGQDDEDLEDDDPEVISGGKQ